MSESEHRKNVGVPFASMLVAATTIGSALAFVWWVNSWGTRSTRLEWFMIGLLALFALFGLFISTMLARPLWRNELYKSESTQPIASFLTSARADVNDAQRAIKESLIEAQEVLARTQEALRNAEQLVENAAVDSRGDRLGEVVFRHLRGAFRWSDSSR